MATASIDKRLNIVLDLFRSDGTRVYIHSTPVSRLVFEANYTIFAKTISSMYADNWSPVVCSRNAWLRMREIAAADTQRFGDPDALFQEIWRLTTVLQPGRGGWEQYPFVDFLDGKGVLSEDDVAEVKNYLCFFTAASWFHSQKERGDLYETLTNMGVEITSLQPMAYGASLQTSKPEENTGEKETPFFTPS
jgi:hypothetical protein